MRLREKRLGKEGHSTQQVGGDDDRELESRVNDTGRARYASAYCLVSTVHDDVQILRST